MRKLIFAILATASLAAPLAAQAYPGELRNDRREVREERRDVHEARRYGDRDDVRQERRELRDARHEWRDDRHEMRDRRHDMRDDRRDRYHAGSYHHPRGYAYRPWAIGGSVPRAYWGQRYWIGNPVGYRLDHARPGTRWVRVGPDALLIRVRNGTVLRVVRGIFY